MWCPPLGKTPHLFSICISHLMSEVDHLSPILRNQYCFLFCKFSVHFYHFSTEFLIHLLLACGKSCYVKEINTLSVIGIAHIFPVYHLIFDFVYRNLGKNFYSYIVRFITCVPWLSSTQNLSEIIF